MASTTTSKRNRTNSGRDLRFSTVTTFRFVADKNTSVIVKYDVNENITEIDIPKKGLYKLQHIVVFLGHTETAKIHKKPDVKNLFLYPLYPILIILI
jgi:hypothetical protein